ncbi:MAG: TIGR03885 family FMN-dependent LLM class oxidoreductase [Acidovorax sp.]|nr:MAG: TIGR03885 family FMN-dependent LLM class oxidoreductase [Acidovorax sp.]
MARIGFHASHEQFSPGELLDCARAAELAGFDCLMSSDHLAPWSERQGQSGFAWAWLGAAMQATSLPFGLITVPSGWRYHPVVTAQAGATLAQMFPGRMAWLALGSGEALNECMVGADWPEKPQRNERLFCGAQVIRSLWRGEEVTVAAPIPTRQAKLYTLATRPPPLLGAALSPETARWMGGWADGLLTVHRPLDDLRRLVDAFREGGGENKPVHLQVHLSYAADEASARSNALDQWHSNALAADLTENLATPAAFERATANVGPADMDAFVHISADAHIHAAWIERYAEMGFAEIYLHNVGRNQIEFIEAFGEKIKPLLSWT